MEFWVIGILILVLLLAAIVFMAVYLFREEERDEASHQQLVAQVTFLAEYTAYRLVVATMEAIFSGSGSDEDSNSDDDEDDLTMRDFLRAITTGQLPWENDSVVIDMPDE